MAENKMYFLERQETVTDLNREAWIRGGGGVQLVGFTCHAPLQHSLHKKTYWLPVLKEKKTKGEDEKRERTLKGTGEDGGKAIEKTDKPCSIFSPSQEQGEQEGVKKKKRKKEKSELYFFGCLEPAQRSSSTRTQCNKTLRDEVSDRGRQGRVRRKRGK